MVVREGVTKETIQGYGTSTCGSNGRGGGNGVGNGSDREWIDVSEG